MKRSSWNSWMPMLLAAVFFAIPVALFFWSAPPLWAVTDNETVGFGNALNLAYRLADHRMYAAPGITWHPGVTFYVMNWVALALAGYPFATGGFDFFKAAVADAETYHRILVCLAALVGSAGVYITARVARTLVPPAVVIVALSTWLVSTPATVMMFLSPGFESFALLLNGLFLAALVRIASAREVNWSAVAFAGGTGALAYMNKLSYIYIVAALGTAIFVKVVVSRTDWKRGAAAIALFVAAFAAVILAIAYFVIGWDGFLSLLDYHKGVILGSGLYGEGDPTVVSVSEVRKAVEAIPENRAWAMPVALIGGAALTLGGLLTAFRRGRHASVAVLSVGTGLAALLSAAIVFKHYELHYTAGVSATLPGCVIAGYLLARSRGFRPRRASAATAAIAVALMASLLVPVLAQHVMKSRQLGALLAADRREIDDQIAADGRTAEFMYRVPFSEFGEGFALITTGIPWLDEEYLRRSHRTISSFMARRTNPDIGIFVLDKVYFPTAESIKNATNLDLPEASAPVVIRFRPEDRLIELRTVFLLIRNRS